MPIKAVFVTSSIYMFLRRVALQSFLFINTLNNLFILTPQTLKDGAIYPLPVADIRSI